MAFTRRGNITFPYKVDQYITARRIDGTLIRLFFRHISCWEEHCWDDDRTIVIVYFTNGSNIAVRESFEALTLHINKREVAP